MLRAALLTAVLAVTLLGVTPTVSAADPQLGHMVFFTYRDRPGIIGKVGTLLGEHDINIATMDVGRKAEGGDALMCLTVDTEVPPSVLERVAGEIEAQQLRTVTLPPA